MKLYLKSSEIDSNEPVYYHYDKKYFDIDVSDKVEYICNTAEVLSISENEEI